MDSVRRTSVLEQTVQFIRGAVAAGWWKQGIPGVRPLAEELGVSSGTVQSALRLLEKQGIILPQGVGKVRLPGRASRNEDSDGVNLSSSLRVGLLVTDPNSPLTPTVVRRAAVELEKRGHRPFFSSKLMATLDQDPKRGVVLMADTPTDAWIGVYCSRPALETVAEKLKAPFLGWGGNVKGLPIAAAGCSNVNAIRSCTRRLLALGHRRIVLVIPEVLRIPSPGLQVVAFREELAAAGIMPTTFNVPDWEETAEGYHEMLRSLFSLTPPTAMIVDGALELMPLMSFLAARGQSIPRDLSVVVRSEDAETAWMRPRLAHYEEAFDAVLNHVVQWVEDCATGSQQCTHAVFDNLFVDGDSIAPPGGGRR